MYTLKQSSRFKKDLKRLAKQKKDLSKLEKVIDMLAQGVVLPPEYKDHGLGGNHKDHRECHIEPDWLLVYEIKKAELILTMISSGTHEKSLHH
jgi:mRNA interferase YafQ